MKKFVAILLALAVVFSATSFTSCKTLAKKLGIPYGQVKKAMK